MVSRSKSTANIAHILKDIEFPCSKDRLVKYARMKKAPDEVLDVLNKMPEMTYHSMADVFKGIGEVE